MLCRYLRKLPLIVLQKRGHSAVYCRAKCKGSCDAIRVPHASETDCRTPYPPGIAYLSMAWVTWLHSTFSRFYFNAFKIVCVEVKRSCPLQQVVVRARETCFSRGIWRSRPNKCRLRPPACLKLKIFTVCQ